MSPNVFRFKGYRYFFFSREESRMHVHVRSAKGEAKFWLEPEIELAENHRLNESELNSIEKIVKERCDELVSAWKDYFASGSD